MLGFFDSGLGGLTIVKEVLKILPQYDLIYFGDTAHVPYGNRSQDEIYRLTCEAVDFLFGQGAELIIIACATASSEALRRIQQEYLPVKYPDKRVLGVIRPLAEEAARQTKNGRVGVVGTRGTVASGAFEREIEASRCPDQGRGAGRAAGKSITESVGLEADRAELKVFQQACPLLVPLIEEGWLKKRETKTILRNYIAPLKRARVDTLVLGCTHYPLIFDLFQHKMGSNCRVLNTGEIVALSLQDYLTRHPEIEGRLEQNAGSTGQRQFWVSDLTPQFKELAQRWLGCRLELKIRK